MTRRRIVLLAAVALVTVAGLFALAAAYGLRPASLVADALRMVERAGPFAPLVLAALFVAASLAFVPVSVFTMASGALFGLLPGVALVYAAALVGASLSFAVARGTGRRLVEERLGRDPRIAAIDRAIGRRGLAVVFLLRLSPLIPFAVLNYGLGLTRVRYRDFVLGSVGMIPAVFMYVSAGAAAGEMVAVVTGAREARSAGSYALLAVGLAATVMATWFVTRLATQALNEQA